MSESLFRLFASSYSQFQLTRIHNESVMLHRLCIENLDVKILHACIFMKTKTGLWMNF
jgi:hypothetical protein